MRNIRKLSPLVNLTKGDDELKRNQYRMFQKAHPVHLWHLPRINDYHT
jgi:hypothetical protein